MRDWIQPVLQDIELDVQYELESNAKRRVAEKEHYFGDDTFSQEKLAVFKRMLASVDCETVWKAFERRSSPDAKRWLDVASEQMDAAMQDDGVVNSRASTYGDLALRIELRRSGQGSPLGKNISIIHTYNPKRVWNTQDVVGMLAATVTDLLREQVPTETKGVRAKKLKEVEAAVSRLKESIEPFTRNPSPRRPNIGTTGAVSSFAREQVDIRLEQAKRFSNVQLMPEEVAIGYQGATAVIGNLDGLLTAVVAEVAAWAGEVPEIDKPNHPNAARTLFIRRLTAEFRDWFGEALRGSVLAIVRVFFEGSDDLTEASIAQLAP